MHIIISRKYILFESTTTILTTAFVPFLRTSVSVEFSLSVTYIYVQFSFGLLCQWALSRQWTDLATISRKKRKKRMPSGACRLECRLRMPSGVVLLRMPSGVVLCEPYPTPRLGIAAPQAVSEMSGCGVGAPNPIVNPAVSNPARKNLVG